MYYYIPHAVIVLAGAGIVYALYRKVPVILQLPKKPETIIPREKLVQRAWIFVKELFLAVKNKQWGPAVLAWLEKKLRQLRIFFMRLDSWIQAMIERSRDKSQTWLVRSKAWREQKRQQKLDKLKVMEKLDKVEFLEMLDKKEPAEEGTIEKEKTETRPEEKRNGLQEEKELINRIAKNPKDKEAYLGLGKLYLKQGNLEDAEASLIQVLKLDPENRRAKRLLDKIADSQ